MMPMMGMMQMMYGSAHMDGRLAFLRAQLKITSAQEKAWDDFANALRQAAKTREASNAIPMMRNCQQCGPAATARTARKAAHGAVGGDPDRETRDGLVLCRPERAPEAEPCAAPSDVSRAVLRTRPWL